MSSARAVARPVANLLSFDIEGQAEALEGVMDVPARYLTESLATDEIQANTSSILQLLADLNQKATFFVLGRIARDTPQVVRAIAAAGHEVACHGFYHRRLFLSSRGELRQQLGEAKQRLEDVIGAAVEGFRAPQFSILQGNRWVFDVLVELGYLYDSSVYPTGLSDAYGIPSFTTRPMRLPNGLIVIPLSVCSFLRWRIPFGGGGYLRLYPYFVTKWCFRSLNRAGVPGMIYLHPYEVGDVIHRVAEMSSLKRWRRYVGRTTVRAKVSALVRDFNFLPISEYLRGEGFELGQVGASEGCKDSALARSWPPSTRA